jgi:hypothetical protein
MAAAPRAPGGQGKGALRRLTAAALVLAACASPGMPPGGPPDVAAPQILAIAPDSGRVGVTPREVVFRFDEVVNERPQSVTNLADLFLISPRDGAPRVSWNRDEIAVRPRGDWRPNTAYTVTMMGGLTDIRGNVRNAGASTFFSTGPTVPRTRITGHVFDWVAGAPAAGALLEAYVPPDSVRAYIAVSDSSGRFALEHLPPGRYVVRGIIDRNKNRGIDASEPWDSATITLSDSTVVELLAFARDTIAPRIRDVNIVDSLSIRVSFDRPVDPTQQLTAANFSVIGRDSVAVALAGVLAGADTAATPRTDTTARPARADTLARPRPVMSRPRPFSEVVLRFVQPLAPAASYRIRAIGLRGLLGHVTNSERSYTTPGPTTRPATDSVRRTSPAPAAPPVRR